MCVVLPKTRWPTEEVKWKERPVFNKHTTFVHENLNQHFSAPEEFKNTPANLPQSANTVVKLTGLPDLLHTYKQKQKNLSASSGYERAEDVLRMNTRE